MDSIAAKVNSFKEMIVGLEQQLIDGNAVKGIVDFGTNALSVFTKLNSVVGTLPSLFAAISSIVALTGKDAGKQNMPLSWELRKLQLRECFVLNNKMLHNQIAGKNRIPFNQNRTGNSKW